MRMETHIKSNDFDSWQVISCEDNQVIINGEATLTSECKRAIEKNNSAKNPLLNVIASFEVYLISSFSMAKHIWDILSDSYEGTVTIKDTKINALMKRYELFNLNLMSTLKMLVIDFCLLLMN